MLAERSEGSGGLCPPSSIGSLEGAEAHCQGRYGAMVERRLSRDMSVEAITLLDFSGVRLVVGSMREAGVLVDRVFFNPDGILVIAHRLGNLEYVTAFLGRRRITAPADSDWRDRLLSGVSL